MSKSHAPKIGFGHSFLEEKNKNSNCYIEILYFKRPNKQRYFLWNLKRIKNSVRRMKMAFDLEDSEKKENIFLILIIRNKNSFSMLECLILEGASCNSRVLVNLLKIIDAISKKIKFLSFYKQKTSETLVLKAYFFMKKRYLDANPLSFQLLPFYERNLVGLPIKRVGYILSRLGVYCEKLFHTQVDRATNQILMKYFLTSADLASRKMKKSYISTGGFYKLPTEVSVRFEDIWKYADVKNNPKKFELKQIDDKKLFYEDLESIGFML